MRAYVKPMMDSEVFVANEYVSACWWVDCNIDFGDVYLETNGEEGLQTSGRNSDTKIGSRVTGCGRIHNGVTEEPTANGYWVERGFFGGTTGTVKDVFSWEDRHGWHSSYIEDAHWDTNPNAS